MHDRKNRKAESRSTQFTMAAAKLSIIISLQTLLVGGKNYCGTSYANAGSRCDSPCPSGGGCPDGEACFLDVSDCDGRDDGFADSFTEWLDEEDSSQQQSSSSSATVVERVEQTFLQMKDRFDNELFLYETPQHQWIPSTVYRFDGFYDGLKIMHGQGVAGKKIYMGVDEGSEGDCKHCHMYGLVNVAAFLAQAMKETIRYDACDENSWDRVGDDEMYAISNSCGQLGQSYQVRRGATGHMMRAFERNSEVPTFNIQYYHDRTTTAAKRRDIWSVKSIRK